MSERSLFPPPEVEDYRVTASQSVRPRPRALRVAAVAGAKGGVGKTLFATNFALYLATIGRRVVVVDADPSGGNVHTCLGVTRPSSEAGRARIAWDARDLGLEAAVVETPVPGLHLLDPGIDTAPSDALRIRRRKLLLSALRSLKADYVVVDLGSAPDRMLLELCADADLAAYVTLPEPTAIENTYRFFRVAFAHALRRSFPEAKERAQLNAHLSRLGDAPAPTDIVGALEVQAPALAQRVAALMEGFHPRVVLNQTRVRADLELGDAMRSTVRRRLGIHLDYLGHIDYDDTVWTCVRMRRALLVESPGTKASKSIEKIARRLLAVDAGKGRMIAPPDVPAGSHHDLLEVERGATDEEVRRAYKRAKEIYADDSLACYGLFTATEMQALRVRLDEAYDVLLDPARRRPYELSVFPPEPEPGRVLASEDGPSEPRPPAPEITPETEFTGYLLRAVRESRGVELAEISHRTKIGSSYLRAIEDDDFDSLPALVYARGFVVELAKCLLLDPEQVSRTYIRRYRRFLEERPKD